ncbi:MAG: PadR family transcriptional regulator [Candidatus Bathycorpusculaceae bacterium]
MTEDFRKQIVQRITKNLLDIQLLRLIETQPMWGYKIKKQVETKYSVKLRHGALYPMLNKLETKAFLTSKKQQQGGRTRKVYAITEKGREYVKAYENILKEQIQKQDIEELEEYEKEKPRKTNIMQSNNTRIRRTNRTSTKIASSQRDGNF